MFPNPGVMKRNFGGVEREFMMLITRRRPRNYTVEESLSQNVAQLGSTKLVSRDNYPPTKGVQLTTDTQRRINWGIVCRIVLRSWSIQRGSSPVGRSVQAIQADQQLSQYPYGHYPGHLGLNPLAVGHLVRRH
ncbi:hypothetical protein BaRGS_00027962 [Batillaria attramentaria]|uniref:Uncharacterized protein n=1 Tax=Batillaria attramentaria TaxID=370345 RepID=A0ABD0K1M7_9CAEN